MLKVTIIAVGKIKEKYFKEGIAEYIKRLSRFCTLEICELEDEPAPDKLSSLEEELVKQKEAARIIKNIRDGMYLIVLDMRGQKLSSEAFAGRIQSLMNSGKSHLCFVIGGSLGLDKEIVSKADLVLSISDMTFPHRLVRLILLEQIYRAFKIINGETYHK